VSRSAQRVAIAASAVLLWGGSPAARGDSGSPAGEAGAQHFLTAAVCDGSYERLEAQIVELTNARRRRAGLAPLTHDLRLAQAAEQQSIAMAAAGQLGHRVDGRSPSQRVRESGYRFAAVVENLAFQARSAREVVEGWMGSPAQRANLLSATFTQTGVGVACDRWGRPYVTQLLALPRSKEREAMAELQFSLRNSTAEPALIEIEGNGPAVPLEPRASSSFGASYLAVEPRVSVRAGDRTATFVPKDGGDYRLVRRSSGQIAVVAEASRR
jgi:uncharacterized protein YkwD